MKNVNRRSKSFWATVEHHRTWFASDGPNVLSVAHHGMLTLETARRVVAEYQVRRTIGRIEENASSGSGLENLVADINANCWDGTLLERAALCETLAERHRAKVKVRGSRKAAAPYSAVSKLTWFVRPTGWTMYDSYARAAVLDGRSGGILEFYKRLSDFGFTEIAAELDTLAGARDLPLYGGRIIDKALMAQTWQEMTSLAEWYLDILPSPTSEKLIKFADTVEPLLERFLRKLSS